MQLYFQSYPDNYLNSSAEQRSSQAVPLIIIPGLFGSTANWRGIARQLSEQFPVILIDQRNHGRSPHADTNSYFDMVGDLLAFMQQHELDQANICGHSMGGKVAMLFALLHPQNTQQLIVIDIAPVLYQHSHAPFLEELAKVDLSELKSRRDADALLAPVIADTGTRLFLLQSLAGSSGSFYWRINLPVLYEYMQEISGFPENLASTKSNPLKTLMIHAGQSNYVLPEHHAIIRQYFPQVEFKLIPEVGHWLHAEQPEKVLKLVTEFVK